MRPIPILGRPGPLPYLLFPLFLQRFDVEPEIGKRFSENFSRPRFAWKYSILTPVYRRLSIRDSRLRGAEVAEGHDLTTRPSFDPFPISCIIIRLHTLEAFLAESQN